MGTQTNLKGEEELHITVNRIVEDKERLPLAYLLGSNVLIFVYERKKK